MTTGSHWVQELVTEKKWFSGYKETSFFLWVRKEKKALACCVLHIYPPLLLHGDRMIRVSLEQETSLRSPHTPALPPSGAHGPHGQSERGQSCSCAPSLPIPAAPSDSEHQPRKHQRQNRPFMAGVRSQPWIISLLWVPENSQHTGELTVVRRTCCSYTHSLAAVAGAGGKGQEPLKVQTNTSGMLRSLLGGGRAIKK